MTDTSTTPSEAKPLNHRGLKLLIGGFAEKAGLWRMRERLAPTDYARFLSLHPRRLCFCLLWIFASSVGQTFFLSIFQPYWMKHLRLDPASIGAIYGAATVGSALLLRRLGQWTDAADPRVVAGAVAIGLAFGSFVSGIATHWVALLVGVFALRLFGQGLASMLGTNAAARWFPTDQAKAVSVAGLGFPLGEAILPALLIFCIGTLGWRNAAVGSGAVVAFALLPLSLVVLGQRKPATAGKRPIPPENETLPPKAPIRFFREPRFLMMLAVTTPLPFFATGVIFFQATFSEQLGWPPHAFATGFLCFALTRAGFGLWAGALADRVGPLRLLGSPLLLFGGGLFCLLIPHHWGVYAFFVIMGLGFGIAGATTTPIWALLFGIDRLGESRGASAAIGVFSTALAPFLFGALLQLGLPPQPIFIGSALFMILVAWPLSFILRRLAAKAA